MAFHGIVNEGHLTCNIFKDKFFSSDIALMF